MNPKKPDRDNRNHPGLTAREDELRTLWILYTRHYLENLNGRPSKYYPGVYWDGGVDRETGRHHKTPVWRSLLDHVVKSGYSAIELLEALYAGWAADRMPTPWAIVWKTTLLRAAEEKKLRKQRIANSLRTEEAIFRSDQWGAMQSIPDPREAIRRVLNDTGRRILSPLFRYSVATKKNLPDVASRWNAAAIAQLMRDPQPYLEYWSAMLPDELLTMAREAVA